MKQFKHQEYRGVNDIISIYSTPVTGVTRCSSAIICESRYTNTQEKCNGYRVVTREGHYCPCKISINSRINEKEMEWSDSVKWRES